MFLRRDRRGPDRFLDLRVKLFFAGAALLVAGMALERRILVGVAAAVLVAAFILGLVGRFGGGPGDPPPGEES
jgi:hypothetical protein